MVRILSAFAFNLALVAVGCHALRGGGRPEKLGALVFVLASLASAGARLSGWTSWEAGGPTIWIDIATMLFLFWLGFATTRFWPVWAFAMLICVVFIDVVKLVMPAVTLMTFQSGQVIYAYLALGSLSAGILIERIPLDPSTGFRSNAYRSNRTRLRGNG